MLNWFATWPSALRFDPGLKDAGIPHLLMLEEVFRRACEFDVIHCHLDYYHFSFLKHQSTPFLTTLHGRLDSPEVAAFLGAFPDAPLVSISITRICPGLLISPDCKLGRC
jgi:hypothetical protein